MVRGSTARAAAWKVRWLPMLLLMLPGVALITASYFVPVEAMQDGDIHPMMALGIFFIAVPCVIIAVMALKGRATRRLVEKGIHATAEVLGIRETGARVNDMPVARLRLLVTDGRGSSREVEHKQVLPRLMLMEIGRGDRLEVRVRPKRPDKLLILFGTQTEGSEGGQV